MNKNIDKALKSVESVSDLVNRSIQNASKQAGSLITPSRIVKEDFYKLTQIPVQVNPLVEIAVDQLAETKKMNETIGSLENRIKDLENKNELASKNQWKHDLLMTVIGAVLAFIFGLIILLFD